MKRIASAFACATAIACFGMGSALAGEIKGPGSPTGIPAEGPDTAALAHTNSICAASGLNEFHAGEPGEFPTRTQSYGQLVQMGLKDFVPSPGEACNGHLSGLHG